MARQGTSACGWCLDRALGQTKKPCHGGRCGDDCPCPDRRTPFGLRAR